MKNPISLLATVAITLFVAGSFLTGDDPDNESGLPGARAAIDSSQYATLQDALNALPPEGGLVQLPAGTFEIDEPLILSTEDVTIEGHGTATHIKNVNTEGKPALVIKHREFEKDTKKNRLWRIRLANFRITGNEKSGHGIEAHYINEILIDGVTVSYHGGDGIFARPLLRRSARVRLVDHLQQGHGVKSAGLSRHCRFVEPIRRESGRAALH